MLTARSSSLLAARLLHGRSRREQPELFQEEVIAQDDRQRKHEENDDAFFHLTPRPAIGHFGHQRIVPPGVKRMTFKQAPDGQAHPRITP